MKKARLMGGLGEVGERDYSRRVNFDPIFLGWIGAVCVLAVINWLRGGK